MPGADAGNLITTREAQKLFTALSRESHPALDFVDLSFNLLALPVTMQRDAPATAMRRTSVVIRTCMRQRRKAMCRASKPVPWTKAGLCSLCYMGSSTVRPAVLLQEAAGKVNVGGQVQVRNLVNENEDVAQAQRSPDLQLQALQLQADLLAAINGTAISSLDLAGTLLALISIRAAFTAVALTQPLVCCASAFRTNADARYSRATAGNPLRCHGAATLIAGVRYVKTLDLSCTGVWPTKNEVKFKNGDTKFTLTAGEYEDAAAKVGAALAVTSLMSLDLDLDDEDPSLDHTSVSEDVISADKVSLWEEAAVGRFAWACL